MVRFYFHEATTTHLEEVQAAIEALPEVPRGHVVHALDRHWITVAAIAADLVDDTQLTAPEWAVAFVVLAKLACRHDTARRMVVIPMSPGGEA